MTAMSDLVALPDSSPALDQSSSSPQDLSPLAFMLNVTGVGTVSSTPAGLSCPATCIASFAPGTMVTLDVAGSFKAWGNGPCSGGPTPCTFTLAASGMQDAAFYAAGRFPTTARATVADVAALNPTSVTVEAWVSLNSASEPLANQHVAVVSKGAPLGGAPSGYQLGYLWDGANFKVEFVIGTGGVLFGCDGTTAIAAGVHHLAGQFDASTGSISAFVDGASACSGINGAGTITAAAGSPLVFGAPSGASSPFNGILDEVRISSTALYPAAGFTPTRHPAVGASGVGLWHFDEGTGTTIGDSSATAANATAAGTNYAWVAEP
jgi:hypothetical protein